MVKVLVSEASRNWAKHLDDSLERWRIRHELSGVSSGNEVRKMPLDHFKKFIKTINRQALLELKNELDIINSSIKIQLTEYHKNTWRNNSWAIGAKKVKRICGRHSQAIQNRLTESGGNRKKFPQFFMDVAEEFLSSEDYEKLIAETKNRMVNEYRNSDGTGNDGVDYVGWKEMPK
jgi:hypothetical protein